MVSKLQFGMVGGGEGAFIGPVHRMAAEMDGLATLVCGAFSAAPEKSVASGMARYGLPAERCYGTYEEMFAAEARRAPGDGMDFVIIATPNHLHVPIAMAALRAGFHVVCDKPLALNLDEAQLLSTVLAETDRQFALTHNYTGYPMIREAQQLVRAGVLGSIRRVDCRYLQGWLSSELGDHKQASWRTDPARSGAAGAFGDIGTHAHNLVRFVTELEISELCADLTTFIPGRQLEDDGNVLLRFANGARGTIAASQIALGKENDLSLGVYGELASLEWEQQDANSLIIRYADRPLEVRRSGGPGIGASAHSAGRLPPGHPEGYLEAFAEIYRNFCLGLLGKPGALPIPGIEDGIAGMRFVEQVVASAQGGGQWVPWD